MLNRVGTNSGRRHRRPLAGGSVKMEYLFAGALGVIIVGALALTLYYSFFSDDNGPSGLNEPYHFKCINKSCGAEFVKTPQQLEADGGSAEFVSMTGVLCPKCGKKSGYQMEKCPLGTGRDDDRPKCGTYFLSKRNVQPDATEPAVCPKCGTDVDEYWRAEALKRRGK